MANKAIVLCVKIAASAGILASIFYAHIAHALFEGNVKLACEAVLCLSSENTVKECAPSLAKYYSIKFKKRGKTGRARQDFLNICPR